MNGQRRILVLALWAFLSALLLLGRPSLADSGERLRTNYVPGKVQSTQGEAYFLLATNSETKLLEKQGVDFNQGLRTALDARAVLQLADQTTLRICDLTRLWIQHWSSAGSPPGTPRPGGPIPVATNGPFARVSQGQAYFINRSSPSNRVTVLTPRALATPVGTEFLVRVDGDTGESEFTMFDGRVHIMTSRTNKTIYSGQQGIVLPDDSITVRPILEATNIVQWFIYYPAVLDLEELPWSPAEQTHLAGSLAAFSSGDILQALQELPGYPNLGAPASEAERIYRATLLLGVGAVDRAEAMLRDCNPKSPPVRAHRTMIAAVASPLAKPDTHNGTGLSSVQEDRLEALSHYTASEWLALSYAYQANNNLPAALRAATNAVSQSPRFGFGWARVAELEFSFGRTAAARRAVARALAISPKNAQAHALEGFLLAAENRLSDALAAFESAIRLDPSLANGWLGRGLCHIRLGENRTGLEDLQTAAVLEPRRSLLRSYVGKALSQSGDSPHARTELDYAKELDANDPTPWLYAALEDQQANRINAAIRDLEKSSDLNDNRALFRSRLLLDQDRAVRSANLAGVYRDAGMTETSRQEAARAVTCDYANDSAHLFISDSFNELRDPTRFNLRYETVWFSELLLANLLAPVGAGRLSQTVTAQEYSKLLEADGLGVANDTTVRSDGQVRELASQFGTFRNTSWALDFDYQHNNGVRPNNELDRLEWYTTVKQQLTPADTILLLAKYENYSAGDNFQYYDPAAARPHFKFEEHQEPILVGGYQHEWTPGVRTLLLGGRLVNEQEFSDQKAPQLVLYEDNGSVTDTGSRPYDVRLTDQLEIYTAELNQIFQRERFSLVAGALWQGGHFGFDNVLSNASLLLPQRAPPVSAAFSEPFERLSGYGYLTIEPLEKLWLIGGVSFDHLEMPANFRNPPQSAGTEERELLGPKAAFVWRPVPPATLRGIYSRSLGGVSLDESYRLEPTQLAGFPQAFRSVISESLVGSVAAPEYEVMGLALDLKLGQGTYGGVQIERIGSQVEQTIGVFRLINSRGNFVPSTTREWLDYTEQSFAVNLNRLLGERFVVGLNYRLTRAQLETTLPEVPASLPGARQDELSWLHQLGGYLLYNDPSGFFARFDARYYHQSNTGYTPAQPGDDLVQLDLQAGYRFLRRKAELSVGILNLTDQDYHLNPLTVYSELPRERVFVARFSFRF